jgi:lysozyme family protein
MVTRALLIAILCCVAITPCLAADIRPALTNTFGHEGGYQRDPDDSGNYANGRLVGTKYGIAAASYPHEDIRNLTIERAAQIYQRDFWGASRCDDWKSQIVAENYFELAVNAGQGSAARLIQRAANRAAWPAAPIAVDGNIGPATVARINSVNQELLTVHFFGMGYAHYGKVVAANPVKAKYMRTWALRWSDNVKRTVRQADKRG